MSTCKEVLVSLPLSGFSCKQAGLKVLQTLAPILVIFQNTFLFIPCIDISFLH